MSHGAFATDRAAIDDEPAPSPEPAQTRWSPARLRMWHVALVTAVVGTVAYYLPLVGGLLPDHAHWPGFMLTGDQRMAYFPSFVEGYRRFWHGGLAGIDFFTEDGASAFAFRPNLMPYYPPFLAAYLLVDCSNVLRAMQTYVVICVLHQFVGLFFTVVFAKRYLRFPLAGAVLAASLYALSWYAASYSREATFYFQMMLLPLTACTFCFLLRTPSRVAVIWASPVFITVMLSNYGPTMLASLGLAAAAAAIAVAAVRERPLREASRASLKPALSVALAGAACLPYVYAQLRFKSVMMATADDIDQVAHSLSFSAFDLLNGASQFLDIQRTHYEIILVWGAIPLFLGLVGLDVLITGRDRMDASLKRAIGLSALVYVATLLPTFGSSLLSAADGFYYAVPVLGKMHIFQRYVAFSSFFFALTVAGLGVVAAYRASPGVRRSAAYLTILAWIGVGVLVLVLPPSATTDGRSLVAELFLTAVTGVAMAAARPAGALLLASALCAVIGLTPIYSMSLTENRIESWQVEPDPLGPEMQSIVDFIRKNSDGKALSKLVLATPVIETYLNRNLPWILGTRAKVMNFQGYPPHLSVLADYGARWGTYGQFDMPWLKTAGLDFVFWDDGTAARLNAVLADGYKVRAALDLPYGHHLAKVERTEAAVGPLLDMPRDKSAAWPKPMLSDGWAVKDGSLVTVPGGQHQVGYHVDQLPGSTYDLSLDIDPGSSGPLTIAFGNVVVDTLGVAGAAHFERRVTTSKIGDLWITGAPGFQGGLSDILVKPVVAAEARVSYDNGLFRVTGDADPVEGFDTDYARRMALRLASEHPVDVTYLLWPSPYMVPFVDGVQSAWADPAARPATIVVPAGRHVLEVRFVSLSGRLFSWLTTAYVVLVLSGAGWALFGRRARPSMGRLRRSVLARVGRV